MDILKTVLNSRFTVFAILAIIIFYLGRLSKKEQVKTFYITKIDTLTDTVFRKVVKRETIRTWKTKIITRETKPDSVFVNKPQKNGSDSIKTYNNTFIKVKGRKLAVYVQGMMSYYTLRCKHPYLMILMDENNVRVYEQKYLPRLVPYISVSYTWQRKIYPEAGLLIQYRKLMFNLSTRRVSILFNF